MPDCDPDCRRRASDYCGGGRKSRGLPLPGPPIVGNALLDGRNKHMATGNGGNLSIFIPDLDLVVAATGRNYSDRANFVMLTEIIPKYILPAILD